MPSSRPAVMALPMLRKVWAVPALPETSRIHDANEVFCTALHIGNLSGVF